MQTAGNEKHHCDQTDVPPRAKTTTEEPFAVSKQQHLVNSAQTKKTIPWWNVLSIMIIIVHRR